MMMHSDIRSHAWTIQRERGRGVTVTSLPFAQLPGEVLIDDRLKPTHIRVLIALYMHLSKHHRHVWPKRETLSRLTGLHESKVSRATTELERFGWVTKVGTGGRSRPTTYYVHVPDCLTPPRDLTIEIEREANDGETVAESDTVSKTDTVAELALNPSQIGHKTVAKSARGKEHTKNIPRTDNTSARAKTEPLDMPDWLSTEAWAMWDRFRKKKDSRAWTIDAKRLSIRKLEKLQNQGFDHVGVIEQSVQRGWTGLFPLRENRTPQPDKHGNFGERRYVGTDTENVDWIK